VAREKEPKDDRAVIEALDSQQDHVVSHEPSSSFWLHLTRLKDVGTTVKCLSFGTYDGSG
jgi:hypothetical protein